MVFHPTDPMTSIHHERHNPCPMCSTEAPLDVQRNHLSHSTHHIASHDFPNTFLVHLKPLPSPPPPPTTPPTPQSYCSQPDSSESHGHPRGQTPSSAPPRPHRTAPTADTTESAGPSPHTRAQSGYRCDDPGGSARNLAQRHRDRGSPCPAR